jgi:hypothetical protein
MSTRPFAPLPPLDVAQRYTVIEAMAYLRTSRQTIFANIKAGLIGTIKEGKRRYVPGAEIARLSSLPSAAQGDAKASKGAQP